MVTFWARLQLLLLQYARTGAQKVARVVVRMESEQVGLEQPLQQLLAHGQHAVDLTGREGGMEEPRDLDETPRVAEGTRE